MDLLPACMWTQACDMAVALVELNIATELTSSDVHSE